MASAKAKIRHVFGDTFSCRAAPPDILVKLSARVALAGCRVRLFKSRISREIRPNTMPRGKNLGSEFPIAWYSLKNTMDTCY